MTEDRITDSLAERIVGGKAALITRRYQPAPEVSGELVDPLYQLLVNPPAGNMPAEEPASGRDGSRSDLPFDPPRVRNVC